MIRMLQQMKNLYHLLEAIVANIWYGFPAKNLKVIAITGTDGKTTTSTLVYAMLKAAGKKVALISTVAAFIGSDEIDTGFHVTTPSSFALQRLLKKIAKHHMEYVVLETTSHGIDQNRVWGITPYIAAITNVTHEHLDYHKTFEKYVETKSRLLRLATHSILNEDAAESYTLLADLLKDHGYISTKATELSAPVKKATEKRFGAQQYNFENVAIAVKILSLLEISEKPIIKAITEFAGVPGRMQQVSTAHGVRWIVDFAHTPAALEQALKAVQADVKKDGRVIVIFGCAGLRDHTKRPLMGEIAGELADLVILTAEDPRTEDVWAIIAQIKCGVKPAHVAKIISIPDRGQAIEFASTKLARPGDTILVTGKGHEKSMCYGDVEYPWNDADAIKKTIYAN